MNISSIADMLRADPACADDLPAFLKRMNERDISRVKTTREIVAEETVLESIADGCGGEATAADVATARALIAQEPLQREVEARLAKVRAAIEAGQVTTLDEAKTEFGR